MRKNTFLNTTLITIMILCFFQDFISSIFSPFQYYDELLVMISVPLFVVRIMMKKGKLRLNSFEKHLDILTILFISNGIICYLLNSSQPIQACLGDVLLCMKWFLSIYIGYIIRYRITSFNYKKWNRLIWVLTIILAVMLIFNDFFHIFEGEEMRFGIQIPKLFYSHSSVLAAMGTLLMIMTYCFYKHIHHPKWLLFGQLFIVFSTLRYKAMAMAIVGIMVFFIVVVQKQKLRWWHYAIGIVGVTIIAWDQISVYYGAGITNNARGMLTLTSIIIAKELFPFGIGFGSFASHMSKVYYSEVYAKYGLTTIWGLSKASGSDSFISDTFWPMIVGQFGVAGFLIFVLIIISWIKKIKSIWKFNRYMYLSGIMIIIYLLIESTASAAFVGPEAVPFGIWMGTIYACTKIHEQGGEIH